MVKERGGRMTTTEIINDIESMQVGQKKYYPEGNFYIDRFKASFRISCSTEMHYSAQAKSLRPHIVKAIKNWKQAKDEK
jgi:hypothetical protein